RHRARAGEPVRRGRRRHRGRARERRRSLAEAEPDPRGSGDDRPRGTSRSVARPGRARLRDPGPDRDPGTRRQRRARPDIGSADRAVARRHLPPRARAARPRGPRPGGGMSDAAMPAPRSAAASTDGARRLGPGCPTIAAKEFADHVLSARFYVLLIILGVAALIPLYFAAEQ